MLHEIKQKKVYIKYYSWEPWKVQSLNCFELWNMFVTIFGQWEFPKYRTNCWSFGPAKIVVLLDRCCFWWSRAPVHQAISKTVNTIQYTVQWHYNMVNFIPNPHKRHPIARLWGWAMGCLLRVQPLIKFCPSHRNALYNIMLYQTAL